MSETAVTDTGPPLHLVEIDREDTLTLWARVVASTLVYEELAQHGVLDQLMAALGSRLVDEAVPIEEIRAQRDALPAGSLSAADLSVLALAERLHPDMVLTDDLELRKATVSSGHAVSGRVGVLFRAYADGILDKAGLRAGVDALFSGATLYLSRGFRALVRRLVDEA